MSIRNLEYLFRPRSVALIGATDHPNAVGAVLAANLQEAGLTGPLLFVNPRLKELRGVPCYPDVASLPVTPDLAVIATPPPSVPGLVAELGARGTRAVVVISAGFGEGGDAGGAQLSQALLDAAHPYNLRVIGPNCLGILVPRMNLNASFAHLDAAPGHLAFVAQSGAVVTSVLDWAQTRGIGFSHLVSLGDMVDVDFGDMLDYLANDGATRAILLYIEAVTHARKFLSAARAASRSKPVIVVKAGRHAEGAAAAASHTGALAGADDVYDAAFQRAGMLRVYHLEELFDAVEALGVARPPSGDRLAILTNGGGIGVLATDALMDLGGRLAELSPDTITQLNRVLPPTWSHGNPVDIIGDAGSERYTHALDALRADPGVDAVMVLNCPTAVSSNTDIAQALIEALHGKPRDPVVLTSWVGGKTAATARHLFAEHQIPTYDTPSQAARAFMYLVDYKRRQELLMETPPSLPEEITPDRERAAAVVAEALKRGRNWLTAADAREVLIAYGIPTVPLRVATTPDAAAALAAEIGGVVALKILSKDILHKSDVQGVMLNLAGPAAVRDAAEQMVARVHKFKPDAKIDGFTVEPMVQRPGAHELLIGVVTDPQFGPVIVFGQGGTAVEVVKDKAIALPPLNMKLARDVIDQTRIAKLLAGFRNEPAVNLDAVAQALMRVAQLVIDVPEVAELDINPMLADEYGVIALDTRIRVEAVADPSAERLAIRPYPSELEEEIPLADGRNLLLRPIVPEDEPALQATFARLTPEEIRLRFFVPMKTLSHVAAARFTQIDYDREMALVVTERGIPGRTDIHGVVHIMADPDNDRAEYAIIVHHDMTGMGLGILLMRRIIDYACARGIGVIFGDVLRDNKTMLKLCSVLGFKEEGVPDEPNIVRVTLTLNCATE